MIIVRVIISILMIYQCYGYNMMKHRNVISSTLLSISLLGINQQAIALDKLENLSNKDISSIVADDISKRYDINLKFIKNLNTNLKDKPL